MIDNDIAQLLESGCALILGTVDRDGAPEAARAWGIAVLPGRESLRVLIAPTDAVTIENLATTGTVAVTATDVPTLRSVQAKGRALAIEPATDDDRARARWFLDEFFGAIEAGDGTPRALLDRLPPDDYLAFEMTVDALFDQTPGPSAGTPLAGPVS